MNFVAWLRQLRIARLIRSSRPPTRAELDLIAVTEFPTDGYVIRVRDDLTDPAHPELILIARELIPAGADLA